MFILNCLCVYYFMKSQQYIHDCSVFGIYVFILHIKLNFRRIFPFLVIQRIWTIECFGLGIFGRKILHQRITLSTSSHSHKHVYLFSVVVYDGPLWRPISKRISSTFVPNMYICIYVFHILVWILCLVKYILYNLNTI